MRRTPITFHCVECGELVYKPGHKKQAPPNAKSYGGRKMCWECKRSGAEGAPSAHRKSSAPAVKRNSSHFDMPLKTPRELSSLEVSAAQRCAESLSGEPLLEVLQMLGLHPMYTPRAQHLGDPIEYAPHNPQSRS